ncbi:hypothetical protein MIND_00577200 [Mycena indigotica]|uniref:Uncharacterized protein n=1 Tax=Mycena indigotica TaxID=2126181 RepID=A0A8H6W3D0_9AGAR|nr:uncharacterized protein MIND_00577200 [Mycena indigotica]KAF7303482.1 hypothetical protein MIND_00577200 [Mycena indigotica]
MFLLLALSSLASRAPDTGASQCTELNGCRRMFDIVWGCLVTVVACIWVSVHPNVPAPSPKEPEKSAGQWNWLIWHLRDTLGPLKQRLKLMFAALLAPELIVGFAGRQLWMARSFAEKYDVSLAHGFFIGMGGFIDDDGHPIVTCAQISANPDLLIGIQSVSTATLKDKSKGDLFSKGIALCQGLWFVAQCIARRVQNLPLSELEVATLAFATINAFTWLLWWGKPLDVRDPIVIHSPRPAEPRVPPYVSRVTQLLILFTGVCSDDEFAPGATGVTSVPAFWCAATADISDASYTLAMACEFLCAVLFGAIHLAAWGNAFPTPFESWLWRAATLAIVAPPAILVCLTALDAFSNVVNFFPSDTLGNAFLSIGGIFYATGRLFLLVLPFTTLRALPYKTFVDVDWSVYVPHL